MRGTKPLRILHVLGRMERAGAELRTLELMRELDRSRYQFEFCALSGLPGQLDDEIAALGGKVHLVGLGLWFPSRFRSLLKQGAFDAVHSHVHYFTGYILRLAAKEGVPVRIAHFRSTHDGRGSGLYRRAYRAVMKRWLDRHATHILAVSRRCMDLTWGSRWESDERCKVLYDGIDTSLFAGPADREGVRREFNLPCDCKVIVHVGRMDTQKNHLRLISIVRLIAAQDENVYLLLAGREGDMAEHVRALVSESPLNSRVRFLGVRTDVPRLLKAADLLIFPSLWEGLPGAVLEAAAAGCPVLSSEMPSMDEICECLPGVECLSLTQPDGDWVEAARRILDRGNGAFLPTDFGATPFSAQHMTAEFEALLGNA
jgi:glycosyltransferase involved in cell wall biosynthesis